MPTFPAIKNKYKICRYYAFPVSSWCSSSKSIDVQPSEYFRNATPFFSPKSFGSTTVVISFSIALIAYHQLSHLCSWEMPYLKRDVARRTTCITQWNLTENINGDPKVLKKIYISCHVPETFGCNTSIMALHS